MAQASILEMYDPDRSQAVINRARDAQVAGDWAEFDSAMDSTIDTLTSTQGDGLAILSEATSSQTTARLKAALVKRFRRRRFMNTSR